MKYLKSSSVVVGGSVAGLLVSAVEARVGARGTSAASYDPLTHVDPLIGSANGGHVFAGASLPFSMAKAGPDSSADNQGGFATDGQTITGFSHMHDSGTGGASSLGNFPLFPSPGCANNDINQCTYRYQDRGVGFNSNTVKATPGYFSIDLDNGVRGEATVTNHTALYRFTLPKSTNAPMIFVDLWDLPNTRSNGTASVDPNTGRLSGTGTFDPSFGIGHYDLHFCADFSGTKIYDTGVFVNNRAGNEPKTVKTINDGIDDDFALSAGAFTRFAPGSDTVIARVGLSFISVDQACSNGQQEVPDFDFDSVQAAATNAWREKLDVIQIDPTGVSSGLQTTFWSAVYRTMLSPQDYTGENPLWTSSEPYYDSFYCIWDSYRSTFPLLTLTDPMSHALMMRSLIDTYRHEGWLPDCRMSLCKGYTQGGSNADVLLAEAYFKNATGINWTDAYNALIQDAEVEPPNWTVQGRGGLTSWKDLGYIPTDDFDPHGQGPLTRSISRTVEYAYNDFCIAQLAKAFGKTNDYDKYIKRSVNWRNMYNPERTSQGFTGFLQPKFLNGTWGFQNPEYCSPINNPDECFLSPGGHETYEGSCWLYTFYVPQDMASLITTLGGPDEYTSRLSYLHSSGLLWVGDEQSFLPTWQFHYSGHPGLSSYWVHQYIPSQFNDSVTGIPGNDDSGAMAAFSVLSMLGTWPVHGQNVYLLAPPFFKEVSITNGVTGKTATIRTLNFDPRYNNIYIQNVTRDGKSWTKNWIAHDFFENGGLLEITVAGKETSWGSQIADLPPSLSSYRF